MWKCFGFCWRLGSRWFLGRFGIFGFKFGEKCYCVCKNRFNLVNLIVWLRGFFWLEVKISVVFLFEKDGKRIRLLVYFFFLYVFIIIRKGKKEEVSSCCMNDFGFCKDYKLYFVITYFFICFILC